MKKYKFSFTGRQTGAIGIFYKISDTYKANDVHQALSYLYADYEHIQGLTIHENSKRIDEPAKINWQTVRSYTERERSAKTGSYRYIREDAPENYRF